MEKSYADKIKRDREQMVARTAEVEEARELSAEQIAEMLRPDVVGELKKRVREGDVGTSDLIKLLAMLNDRIDGKVAEKVEHTGVVGLREILAEVTGKTAGLPKPEWFDEYDRMGYIDHAGALTAEVADGKRNDESEEDER